MASALANCQWLLPLDGGSLPAAVLAVLETPESARSEAQRRDLARHYRTVAPLLDDLRAQLAEVRRARWRYLLPIPKTLISIATTPRETRVLPRGDWTRTDGELVQPGVPQVLPQLISSDDVRRQNDREGRVLGLVPRSDQVDRRQSRGAGPPAPARRTPSSG